MSCLLVPQVSVLGPILFNCVMSVLLITSGYWYWMSCQCHTNAEDTRFLVNYNETENFNDEETARRRINQAFGLISKFMSENHQKIKSEEDSIHSNFQKAKLEDFGHLVLSDEGP